MSEKYTDSFPCWALCYVVNGDMDVITEEERTMIDNWLDKWPLCDGWLLDFGEESYFEPFPAFGYACDCVEVSIIRR